MTRRPEPLQVSRDPRGWVAEPLAPEMLAGQRNVHVAVSVPGAVRGNHLHRRGTEVLAVQGPALVRLRGADGLTDAHVPPGEVHRFTIPPGVAHAVKNTGDTPIVLVAFNTHENDPAAPDVEPAPIL